MYYYGVNTFDNGFALLARPQSKIIPLKNHLIPTLSRTDAVARTAAQLKGKTVITTSFTDMEQGVYAATRRGNLRWGKDLKIINLPPDEGLAAFLAGQGDAYVGGIPQRTKALKEGMVEILTGSDLGPPPINGLVTTKTFATHHADTLHTILDVWFQIVNYTNTHIDEVAHEITTILNRESATDFTTEDFKRFWNNLEHYPASLKEVENDILSPQGKNYWKRRWDACVTYFLNVTRSITTPPDPEEVMLMPKVHEERKRRKQVR